MRSSSPSSAARTTASGRLGAAVRRAFDSGASPTAIWNSSLSATAGSPEVRSTSSPLAPERREHDDEPGSFGEVIFCDRDLDRGALALAGRRHAHQWFVVVLALVSGARDLEPPLGNVCDVGRLGLPSDDDGSGAVLGHLEDQLTVVAQLQLARLDQRAVGVGEGVDLELLEVVLRTVGRRPVLEGEVAVSGGDVMRPQPARSTAGRRAGRGSRAGALARPLPSCSLP